jgi:hypothetical protein
MKVARLVIYEGPEEWIKSTLARSLAEGIIQLGESNFITVIALDATPELNYLPRLNHENFAGIDE